MKLKFDVTAAEYGIMRDVLSAHLAADCRVWVFGSRAKHSTRFNSDCDLAIECTTPLPQQTRIALNEAFDDAKLAFSVDIVDMKTVEPYFKQIIDSHKVEFPLVLKAPSLRFPEFSGEWEEKKLSIILDFKSGYAFSSSEMCDDVQPYQLIKMSNVYQSVLDLNRSPSYWSSINKSESEFLLEQGDVVLTLTGTVGKKDYGYSVIISESNKYLLNQRLVRLRNKPQLSSPFFIRNLVLTDRFLYKFFLSSKGGTGNQSNVSIEDLKSIKLPIPSLPEQTKIAAFLSTVDGKIDQLSQKKTLLEQYKKGAMQQIFSQQIRFKADDGCDYPEWEEKKLGEVFDYLQPTPYLVSSTEYDDSYDIPVLTAGKTFILGYTNEKEGVFTKNLPVIIFDDFTTDSKYVDFAFKAKSSAMKILVGKNDVSVKFAYEAMQQINYEIGGHGRHWISVFSQMMMFFPCLEEQTKIANFLSAIDSKIEQVAQQLKAAKQFKKGLLQQMFV